MLEQILDPENWKLQPMEEQLRRARENDSGEKGPRPKMWVNSSQLISPLSFYKYLKAKFGPPNGFVMFLKNPSSDNLIHWQYSLLGPESIIDIWGKTSGIEISIKADSVPEITEKDWQVLIEKFKTVIKNMVGI